MVSSRDFIKELKARCCDRYTSAELIDLLDIPIEEVVEIFEEMIIDNELILEELGYLL